MTFLIIMGILVLILGVSVKFDSEFTGGVSLFLFVLMFLGSLVSYGEHYHDLGTVRAGFHKVKVYENRKVSLVNMISKLTEGTKQENLVLMNHDSPQSSLFAELSQVTRDIAYAERDIANSHISIAQRKVGLFSFIVDWMGDK